ncbi:SDR family oxidoreductase [uncultured Roseobacter sp.]|uniref:SDR family oxidoreductase n=1 Tax=uncultured Roseobacter sp. TaxID=114847 RepID=UPI0026189E46|nr:SDR family oxidoreductase [uncultured Roseobacter sp.]
MSDRPFAIIVGGSAGVGRAIVDTLLGRGYSVGVVARGQERLQQLEAIDHITTAPADAGDAAALRSAIESLIAGGGTPTVWINCAMTTAFSPFDKMSPEEFDKIVRTTFLGQVNGTRIALEMMKTGHIVHVGSGLAYRPVPFQSAYCAAKHAINGFVGAVRSEVIRDGRDINLSLVQLPAINTPQFDWARNRLSMKPQPAPPIFSPYLAADGVMQAIDKRQREVFVGTSVFRLIFSDMILPAFLDRKLAGAGVEMQKSDRPEPGGRPDNLFEPVAYDASAKGSFTDRAERQGVVMDADLARKAFFGAIVATSFILGLILG